MSNKTTITKDNLIGIILDKCKDDYISINDLSKIIDKTADEYGNISKKKLVRSIRESHTRTTIKDIYGILEDSIFNILSSVNKNNDVSVRLFEGITLDGNFVSEKTKKNNLTGEMSFVESKIKPKFNITRYYCEKLNNK